MPHAETWIETGYPRELHEKLYAAGIGGISSPEEYGGYRPADYDAVRARL